MKRVTMKQIHNEVIRVFGEHTDEPIHWVTGPHGPYDVTLCREVAGAGDAAADERPGATGERVEGHSAARVGRLPRKRLQPMTTTGGPTYPEVHAVSRSEPIDGTDWRVCVERAGRAAPRIVMTSGRPEHRWDPWEPRYDVFVRHASGTRIPPGRNLHVDPEKECERLRQVVTAPLR